MADSSSFNVYCFEKADKDKDDISLMTRHHYMKYRAVFFNPTSTEGR
jgi:hypothetical protein